MKANRPYYWFITVILIYIALLLLLEHIQTITFSFPNEFREGHIYSSTMLLLQGINPYTLDVYPVYYNSYGILFNLLVYPFAYIFGNSLVLHRFINGLFILATIFFIFKPYLRQKEYIIFNSTIAIVLYAGLTYSQNSTLRPDGLGVFLYILTIALPLRSQFSIRSIILSMIFTLLSFYTKPYFLLGWIILSVYMFFYVDKKKALILNVIFSIVFIVLGIGVFKLYPLYFYETLFAYSSSFGSITYSVKQMIANFRFILPFSFYIVIVAIYIKKKNLQQILANPYLILSAIVSFFLVYPLGVNKGAYLTYHLQLLLPLLSLFFLSADDEILNSLKSNAIVLTVIIFISFQYIDITPSFSANNQYNWIEIENYLKDKKNVLNAPLIAPLLMKENKQVYNTGVSSFVFGFQKKKITQNIFDLDDLIDEKKDAYFNNITQQAKNQKFDAIILNPDFDEPFYRMIDTSNYSLIKQTYLITPHDGAKWDIDIFEPK